MTSGPMGPGFSVCIPCVRASTIAAAVESVKRQTRSDWEIVVSMQGDDPELRARVEALADSDSRVRGIWVREKGVSRARNLAVAAASLDTVVFLDDDCIADPRWLERIHAALVEEPDVGLVAGSLIAPPGPRWPLSMCPSAAPADFTFRPDPTAPTLPPGSHAVTANLAIRRLAWDLIGPFDELLGAGATFKGGEDLDLLLRAVRSGVPIRFCPDAIVHHTHGRRFGARAVLKMLTSYGYGQGAVAAKMTISSPDDASWDGAAWRRQLWRDGVTGPLTSLRVHRVPRSVPRLVAFERGYRRCTRDFDVDVRGFLVPRNRSVSA